MWPVHPSRLSLVPSREPSVLFLPDTLSAWTPRPPPCDAFCFAARTHSDNDTATFKARPPSELWLPRLWIQPTVDQKDLETTVSELDVHSTPCSHPQARA